MKVYLKWTVLGILSLMLCGLGFLILSYEKEVIQDRGSGSNTRDRKVNSASIKQSEAKDAINSREGRGQQADVETKRNDHIVASPETLAAIEKAKQTPWTQAQVVIGEKRYPFEFRNYDPPIQLDINFRWKEDTSVSFLDSMLSYASCVRRSVNYAGAFEYFIDSKEPQRWIKSALERGGAKTEEELFEKAELEIYRRNITLVLGEIRYSGYGMVFFSKEKGIRLSNTGIKKNGLFLVGFDDRNDPALMALNTERYPMISGFTGDRSILKEVKE